MSIDLPVAVPASAEGDALSSTRERIASFLADHPLLLEALVGGDSTQTAGPASDSANSDSAAPAGKRRGFFGANSAKPLIDPSTAFDIDTLLDSTRHFAEKAADPVTTLPWNSFGQLLNRGGGATMPMTAPPSPPVAGATSSASATVLQPQRCLLSIDAIKRGGGVGGGRDDDGSSLGSLYTTQVASLPYTPGCCTGMVVEIVTRRRKNNFATGEKRERPVDDGSVVPLDSKGQQPEDGKQRQKPSQQVIGYRVDSVVTRTASLTTPAEYFFSLSAPEVGLRTAAFPPASFCIGHNWVHEYNLRYLDDTLASHGLRKYTLPPSVCCDWPCAEGAVPMTMSAEHQTAWARSSASEKAAMTSLLEQYPVWRLPDFVQYCKDCGKFPRSHIVKLMLLCLTYTFPYGPFGRIRIRLGAKPHLDPTFRYFQLLTVKLDVFSPIRLMVKDLFAEPLCMSVLEKIKEEARAMPVAVVDTAAMAAQGEKDRSHGGLAFGPTIIKYVKDTDANPPNRIPRLLFYCQLLQGQQAVWRVFVDQFLDDPSFVSIMNHRPCLRQCDEVTGWFHVDVHDKLQNYIRDDYGRWLADEVAPRIREEKEKQQRAQQGGGDAAMALTAAALSGGGALPKQKGSRSGAAGGGKDGADEGFDEDSFIDDDDMMSVTSSAMAFGGSSLGGGDDDDLASDDGGAVDDDGDAI